MHPFADLLPRKWNPRQHWPGLQFLMAFALATGCQSFDRAEYRRLLEAGEVSMSDGAVLEDRAAPDATDSRQPVDAAPDAFDAFADLAIDDGTEDILAVDAAADVIRDEPPAADVCVPSTELCNGRDDDCDGRVDEDFDLMTNASNCGACSRVCALAHSTATCTSGNCVPMCTTGFADCDRVAANGCEADLTSTLSCSRCGARCGTGATCNGRYCSDALPAQVATGGNTNCVLRINGSVWCWGLNDENQVGDGTITNRPLPQPVPGITTATKISVGAHHACALLADRSVRCWGSNSSGALGDGSSTVRPGPVTVTGVTDAIDIQVGRHHACATRATGVMVCWGQGTVGQLGNGTMATNYFPQNVMTIASPTQIASYAYHNCALTSGPAVRCWGTNVDGQIGDGTLVTAPSPVAVPLMNAASLALGSSHSCARRVDGSVVCWGRNSIGQLGFGSTGVSQPSPGASVFGLTGVLAVAAGESDTCAIRADRTLVCWGSGSVGQLGNGGTSSSSRPVLVTGMDTVMQVTVGDDGACVRRMDGSVWCWGANQFGEAGDGTITTAPHLTAVRVLNIP